MKATNGREIGLKDFYNRTVCITGGSSGIGLEISRVAVKGYFRFGNSFGG